MARLECESDLTVAVDGLLAVEPRFAPVVARHGLPSLRHNEACLRSLLRIVTDQLISLKAGEAIWNRLSQKLEPFDASTVLACPEADLRALGLSGSKARTFHAAALAFGSGLFAPTEQGSPPDEQILRSLTGIHGIGPWTAHLYLLTVARSSDAWPGADLALQVAAMDLFSLHARPNLREMAVLAEPWRPYRSAAALLLWSHYRGLKQMPQA